jgi:hypothetical protein
MFLRVNLVVVVVLPDKVKPVQLSGDHENSFVRLAVDAGVELLLHGMENVELGVNQMFRLDSVIRCYFLSMKICRNNDSFLA